MAESGRPKGHQDNPFRGSSALANGCVVTEVFEVVGGKIKIVRFLTIFYTSWESKAMISTNLEVANKLLKYQIGSFDFAGAGRGSVRTLVL